MTQREEMTHKAPSLRAEVEAPEEAQGASAGAVPPMDRPPERELDPRILGLLSMAMFISVWWVLTSGFEVIRPLLWPTPESVVDAAVRLVDVLPEHMGATLRRVLLGLGLGALGGIAVGLAMSANRYVRGLLDPQIESLRPIPPIAAIPFFILWFGLAEHGKVILVALATFMIMVVTTTEAVKNLPPIYLRAAATLGASRRATYRTVVVPAIVPSLIGGLRISAAAAFAVDIAAEFMGAQEGLGYLIMNARRTLQTDVILLSIMVIGVLSAALDQGIRLTARRVTRWSERAPN